LIRSPRKIHKYLSLAISVQLLLWTISGIYFSFNKIEDVRGSQYLKPKEVIETTKGIKIEAKQALILVAEKTYLTPKLVTEITEMNLDLSIGVVHYLYIKLKRFLKKIKRLMFMLIPFQKRSLQ